MGKMVITIPDELERRFRQRAAQKFGAKRGFLMKAATEAIEYWLEVLEGEEVMEWRKEGASE